MDFDTALGFLNKNASISSVIFFEVPLDSPADLDRLAAVAETIGWSFDIDAERIVLRVFRPSARARDLN